eukprot:GFUD01032411.1.p1 GENE.GFUD01032411.1~~GFUD01032411.1.p1  ORF type:complete len:327 (+),score=98.82 GFUD01032411.1:116-1096(+)
MSHCSVCSSAPARVCGGCGQTAYCGVGCQKLDREEHRDQCFPVRVEQMEDKGRGMIATRDIKEGQVVMRDKTIVTAKHDVSDPDNWDSLAEMVSRLPDTVRERYLALQPRLGLGLGEEQLAVRIFLNNAIALGAAGLDSRLGIFPRLSLINHACSPNAKWSMVKGRMNVKVVMAITSIVKGEEVTCSYFGDQEEMAFASKLSREQFLSSWSFVCSCNVCSLEGERLEENERKRNELRKISENIECEEDLVRKARLCLQKLDMVKLVGVEIVSELSYTYQQAYMACWSTGEDDWRMRAELVRLDWRRWVEILPLHSIRLQYNNVVAE